MKLLEPKKKIKFNKWRDILKFIMSLGRGGRCDVKEGTKICSCTAAWEGTKFFKYEISMGRGQIRTLETDRRTRKNQVMSVKLMSAMILLLTAKYKILTFWLGSEVKFRPQVL